MERCCEGDEEALSVNAALTSWPSDEEVRMERRWRGVRLRVAEGILWWVGDARGPGLLLLLCFDDDACYYYKRWVLRRGTFCSWSAWNERWDGWLCWGRSVLSGLCE